MQDEKDRLAANLTNLEVHADINNAHADFKVEDTKEFQQLNEEVGRGISQAIGQSNG